MKPRTILQKEVFSHSEYLPKISEEQKEWAYRECLKHKGFATKKSVTCMDCGEGFSPELVKRKRAVCPHCNTKLKVEYTLKRTDRQVVYFASAAVWWEFQIVRNYEIIANHKKGKKASYSLREILQYWITPEGKYEMVGMLHHTMGYSDSWGGEWGIRKDGSSYYGNKYKIYPNRFHPDSIFKKEYRKYGINHKLDGLNILDAIRIIPQNPYAETLLKAKQYDLLHAFRDYSGGIYRNWSSIKICLRNSYKVKDAGIWIDYLDLLRFFNKDLRNSKYVCPKNLNREHDRLVRKKREHDRRRRERKQRERVLTEQKRYAESKKAFMGLQFSRGNIQIRFLNSVKEVMEEGDALKHCVFASKYYEKRTLLFSAWVNGKRMATVEVDPEKLKVVQLRGKFNAATKHDDDIKKILLKNMDRIHELSNPKKQFNLAS